MAAPAVDARALLARDAAVSARVRRGGLQLKRPLKHAAGALAVVAAAAGVAVAVQGRTPHAVRGTALTLPRHVPAPVRSLRPVRVAAPILMYHVIAPPIARARFPGLYVPPAEFAAQMRALAHAGYHAVTLDELRRAWRGTGTLPSKPIVISFDNGYRSQYASALPVLRRLRFVADENLQLSGLPPAQGGLSGTQVQQLVASGWELDTQGYSHADLSRLDAKELRFQVAVARTMLQRRYHVPVDWFCYPSGRYDRAVVAEVRAAGYVGSTTVAAGWARPGDDPYRLPRLRVLGGTSPQALLALVRASRDAPPPPAAWPSAG